MRVPTLSLVNAAVPRGQMPAMIQGNPVVAGMRQQQAMDAADQATELRDQQAELQRQTFALRRQQAVQTQAQKKAMQSALSAVMANPATANDPIAQQRALGAALLPFDPAKAVSILGEAARGVRDQQRADAAARKAETDGRVAEAQVGYYNARGAAAGREKPDVYGQPVTIEVTDPATGQKSQKVILPNLRGGEHKTIDGATGMTNRAGSARILDRQARRDMLVASGMSEADANRIAAGNAVKPADVVSYRRSRMAALSTQKADFGDGPRYKPEEIERRVDEEADALFGPEWRQAVRLTPQAAPQ